MIDHQEGGISELINLLINTKQEYLTLTGKHEELSEQYRQPKKRISNIKDKLSHFGANVTAVIRDFKRNFAEYQGKNS